MSVLDLSGNAVGPEGTGLLRHFVTVGSGMCLFPKVFFFFKDPI